MRYIAIQREAVEEIVSNRFLQSADFAAGQQLAEFLAGNTLDISTIDPNLVQHNGASKSGRIVTRAGSSLPSYIVFDLEESRLFGVRQTQAESVQTLQRVLRFALKYWEKKVLSPSERIFGQYHKAVVFPYPIRKQTGFRVAIDLEPDDQRLRKRGQTERYLLVYKSGTSDGQGPGETPSLTVFRKFLEDIPSVTFEAKAAPTVTAGISSFQNITISPPPGRLDIHQGYDAWMRVLTNEQKRFVETPLNAPIRIEGPAGTGKTLCLALKAVHELRRSEDLDEQNSSLFVTHSEASRKSILSVLESMDAAKFIDPVSPRRILKVVTLQGLCADILGREISQTELVDPDAYDAKQTQLLYVDEAYRRAKDELPTYAKFLSPEFAAFIAREDDWSVVQLLQHEIGVVIKGRANEQFDSYKRIPTLRAGLPANSEGDKSFAWRVYELYRGQLVAGAQYDTDDVMLSALGQLGTPIWRRRREKEGHDCVYVDETHLFNMNELSVFHHLTRRTDRFQIAFAVDRSQAIGDRGWDTDIDVDSLVPNPENRERQERVRISTVFRCSPEIVDLAFAVTSAGASLFTNFEDPLALANSNLSFEEERKCTQPRYIEVEDDARLISASFSLAETMMNEMGATRGDIAIIAFSDELFKRLGDSATAENKPVELLKERGDNDIVKRARRSGRFVVSMPDYVGGLEFDGVLLVGVDNGRVPPPSSISSETVAFLNFKAHNQLYVAITRARYRVMIVGVRARGPSKILHSALEIGSLVRESV